MSSRLLAVALAAAIAWAPAAASARGVWRNTQRHHGGGHDARHHGHGNDADEVFLWLGLTAVTVAAASAFANARTIERRPPPPPPAPWAEPDGWCGDAFPAQAPRPAERFEPDRPLCREFQREVRIGGRIEHAWGTACLQPDGSWRIIP